MAAYTPRGKPSGEMRGYAEGLALGTAARLAASSSATCRRYTEGLALGTASSLRRRPACRHNPCAVSRPCNGSRGAHLPYADGKRLRRRPRGLSRGRALPRSYADGCPRHSIRRRQCVLCRRLPALGVLLDSCSVMHCYFLLL